MSEWRLIEDGAPMDMTRVLAWKKYCDVSITYYSPSRSTWVCENDVDSDGNFQDWNPTHWKPLDEPPVTE